jgi:DNA mismatch repair protein MutH
MPINLNAAAEFDLDNEYIYAQVKADYEAIRAALRSGGFSSLTGKMGVLIQPRTKGAGHGSTSRAFYARTTFVAHILNIAVWPGMPPTIAE